MGVRSSLISTRHRDQFRHQGFMGDSARTFHARRWTDPIGEALPHKDAWLPPACGVWGGWFFRWWGRGDLAVECSPSFCPSGLGWDLQGLDTQGTCNPRPSLEGLPPSVGVS